MRKTILCVSLTLTIITLAFASCKPRVDVYTHAPEKPIVVKVEIHIYKHAVKDLDYIMGGSPTEETVPSPPPEGETEKESARPSEEKESKVGDFFLGILGIGVAHAETVPDREQLRRVLDSMRKRYPTLSKYKADKSIGENHLGYVQERPSPKMSDAKYAKAVRAIIVAENADRQLLYRVRARMDRTTAQKQAETYAKAWREKYAKPGEWIEVFDKKQNKWVWKLK
jgi:hypothetical protein